MKNFLIVICAICIILQTILLFGCAPEPPVEEDPLAGIPEEELPMAIRNPEAMLSADDPLEEMQAQFPEWTISNYYEYLYAFHYYPNGTPDKISGFISPFISRDVTAWGVRLWVEPAEVPVNFKRFSLVLEQPNEPYVMEFSDTFRFERWEDGEWKRLGFLREGQNPMILDERALFYPGKGPVDPHYENFAGGYKKVKIDIRRDEWLSPIVPGKYRVLVYIGYEATPMYAEFTVVE